MGWLKKHLNPNPIKQLKTQVSDTKKLVGGGSKKKSPGVATGVASNMTGSRNPKTLPSYKQAQLSKLPGNSLSKNSSKPTSRSGVYTTGQGNAPAPQKISPAATPSTIPPVRALRKSSARTSLNNLGTPGKNRFK